MTLIETTPSAAAAIGVCGRLRPLGTVRIRRMTMADEGAYRTFAARLTPDDLRLRFGRPVKPDDPRLLTPFLGAAPGDQTAIAAVDGEGAILGVAFIARVSSAEAEVGLIVRSDLKRRGLGRCLLNASLRHARERGFAAVVADILRENQAMRALALQAGFGFVAMRGPTSGLRLELAPHPAVLSRCA